MMKIYNYFVWISAVLLVEISLCGCSSEKEEIVDTDIKGTGLLGRWNLTEVKNGPVQFCNGDSIKQYPSGYLTIEFINKYDKISFCYADGEMDTLSFLIQQDRIIMGFPIVKINGRSFGYAVEGSTLTLQYLGSHSSDHVPATFFFKRE